MTEAAIPRWSAELVLAAGADLGEGPRWDASAGELVWVDIMAAVVHRFDPLTGANRSFSVGQPVGAANPRAGGGLVLALRDGIALADPSGGSSEWLAPIERDDRRTRMNDAVCDPQGRLWAGTMDMAEADEIGALYRVEPDGAFAVIAPATCSNGLGWSPDGATMYWIDSPHRTLDAFDFDPVAGELANRRTLVELEASVEPDGLTVDADGGIWVALWEGWEIRRYAPEGALSGIVDVPAARVTSCVFGGPALDTLYVTTASPAAPDERQPNAGGVFAARPGVTGQPTNTFSG